jgi:hypothetical protein
LYSSIKSSGISHKNLEGGFLKYSQKLNLSFALVRYNSSFALVKATYINLLSSSKALLSEILLKLGKSPSSSPQIKTLFSSSHFEL